MANFQISLFKTLAHEGEYVNDPVDPGKETYRGISRANHGHWKGWSVIDQYKSKANFPFNLAGNVDLDKQVELFYLYEFWLPLKADQIQNQTTADSIFDFAVNVGVINCIEKMQLIVGTIVDGRVGPKTLTKLNSLDFGYFQPAFTISKIRHYLAIIKKRPTSKKYLYGWIIRALEYHS